VEETRQLPGQGSERLLLQGQLDSLRQTLIRKVDGLDRVAASRRLVPSQTTLLGIMKHSTDTEEWWFRVTMNGENILLTYHTPEDEYADWRIEPHDTVESVVAAYRAACTAPTKRSHRTRWTTSPVAAGTSKRCAGFTFT